MEVTKPAQAAKPKPAPKIVKPATKPAPAPQAAQEEPEEPAAPKTPPAKKAQPAPAQAAQDEGFRLFINCMPVGTDYIDLSLIVAQEGAELADEKGAESFYLLDSFKRRDMLASQAGVVAREQFAGRDVVCIGGNQDVKDYCLVMKQFAREVILGVF
jgi:hypothetical protein